MSKTKINKAVFQTCQKQIETELEQYDYKPHPAYQPGWEPSYQEYVCNWLKSDLSAGIDEVSITWNPKNRFLRISRRVVHPNLDGNTSIQELPTDPSIFSDFWLNYPFVRFTLLPRPRRFWQFRTMDLRLLPQDINPPESIRKVIDEYILIYLPILLEVKEEQPHKYIITNHFNAIHTTK